MRTLLLILALTLPAMAGREFVAGSSQDGRGTIAAISPPITMAAWGWARQSTAAALLIGLNSADNADERLQIYFNGAEVGDPWGISSVNTSVVGQSAQEPSGSGVTNRWQHVAAVFTSSTLRVVYVDGSPRATNTTSSVVTDVSIPSVGSRKASGSYGGYWTGGVAEPAIWNVALTAAEIASLATGMAPYLIRPSALVWNPPLTGQEASTEINRMGEPVTLYNSPAPGTSHPRIFYP